MQTKYFIYAKILGNFLPEKTLKIGNCTIKKDNYANDIELDHSEIPVRSRSMEFHVLEHGLRTFITYPQNPLSTRNFASDYFIITEVVADSLYRAVSEANDRFMDAVAALTLVIKNKTYKLGKRRVRRSDEIYDFEIVASFIKHGSRMERLKLPSPSASGHNYFPKLPPAKFNTLARKIYNYKEPIFKKAMVYLQRSLMMRKYGLFNSIDTSLNLIKIIELLAKNTDKTGRFSLPKKKHENLNAKQLFEYSGKRLKVRRKNIQNAKKAWDERNKNDLGHSTEYYNPYHKESGGPVNLVSLEEATADYLIKYFYYTN